MRLVTVLSTFIISLATVKDVLAAVPSGAITVGSGGKYSTLAAALADTSSNVYYVYSGTYTGQVAISRSNVVIYGETSTSGSYTGNTVTFTDGVTAADAGSNDASGTVRVLASGVKLYNLNIYNTYGTSSSHVQAIALSVQAGSFGCYGCKITGYQDTLLANVGTQVYAHSYISGGVDFIFGMSASIWITQSVIDALGSGCITASGRSSDDANYYVIDSSTIQGSGTQYLGRPWRDYARVIYQNCNIGSNIVAAGWSVWQSTDTRTDHVTYGEYNNVGAGAWNSGRASFATLLTSPISITTVLGSGYTSWVDTSYLSASVATTSTTTKASSTSTSKTSSTTKATSTSSTKATSTSSTKATTSSTTSTTKASSSSTKTTSSSASSGTGAALYGQCGGLTWTGPTTCASGTCTYSNGKFDTRQRYTMNTDTYHQHSSMNIDTYRLLDYYSQCTP